MIMQGMDYAALTTAVERANATLTAVAAIEQQVTFSKLFMSQQQLELAQLACPSER